MGRQWMGTPDNDVKWGVLHNVSTSTLSPPFSALISGAQWSLNAGFVLIFTAFLRISNVIQPFRPCRLPVLPASPAHLLVCLGCEVHSSGLITRVFMQIHIDLHIMLIVASIVVAQVGVKCTLMHEGGWRIWHSCWQAVVPCKHWACLEVWANRGESWSKICPPHCWQCGPGIRPGVRAEPLTASRPASVKYVKFDSCLTERSVTEQYDGNFIRGNSLFK